MSSFGYFQNREEGGEYNDPTIQSRKAWYSTAPGGNANPITGEDSTYCEFCYYNFKKYNECVNNICQSCGRPADFITKNKQNRITVNALNEMPEDNINKGISMIIDYPFLKNDETKLGKRIGERMSTPLGAGEAMRLIRDSERVFDRNSGKSFKVKTLPEEKFVEFDKKTN